MNEINRVSVTKVVDGCYGSSYRIFTVNSSDKYSYDKSHGLFVSLGINTSMATLRSVRNELSRFFPSSNVRIVEIESRLINGLYLNCITNDSNVRQFSSSDSSEWSTLDEDGLNDLILSLKDKLVENKNDMDLVVNYSSKISKISKVLDKFNIGTYNWEDYSVQVIDTDSEFRVVVVSNKSNYNQEFELFKGKSIFVHKRIGIYVEYL